MKSIIKYLLFSFGDANILKNKIYSIKIKKLISK